MRLPFMAILLVGPALLAHQVEAADNAKSFVCGMPNGSQVGTQRCESHRDCYGYKKGPGTKDEHFDICCICEGGSRPCTPLPDQPRFQSQAVDFVYNKKKANANGKGYGALSRELTQKKEDILTQGTVNQAAIYAAITDLTQQLNALNPGPNTLPATERTHAARTRASEAKREALLGPPVPAPRPAAAPALVPSSINWMLNPKTPSPPPKDPTS